MVDIVAMITSTAILADADKGLMEEGINDPSVG